MARVVINDVSADIRSELARSVFVRRASISRNPVFVGSK